MVPLAGFGQTSRLGSTSASGDLLLGNPVGQSLSEATATSRFVAAGGDFVYASLAGAVGTGFGAVPAAEGRLLVTGGTGSTADATGAELALFPDPWTGVLTSGLERWIDS
jgi:hypothetical protein